MNESYFVKNIFVCGESFVLIFDRISRNKINYYEIAKSQEEAEIGEQIFDRSS
jgi:ABC-type enterochelin transport system permease subunit